MKRYIIELGLALIAYAVTLVISLRMLATGVDTQATRIALSLLPMLPGLAMCAIILRHLARLDEFQRKLQLEALALAFTGTALITFSYGFLENVGFPKLSMFAVWPLMAVLWVIGTLVGRIRYR